MRALALIYFLGVVSLVYTAVAMQGRYRGGTTLVQWAMLVFVSPLMAVKYLSELVDFLASLALYHLLGLVDRK